MKVENGVAGEDEKKAQKQRKESILKERENLLYHQKKKEKIQKHMEAATQLFELQELLQANVFDNESSKIAKKVLNEGMIDSEELRDIFDKIDAIDEKKDIDTYIPKNLRITKEEYSVAISDKKVRKDLIVKLNTILIILKNHMQPKSQSGLNLFFGFLAILDKNLVNLQEYHIDIKQSLQKCDKNEAALSWWQRFIHLLKEIFS